MDWLLKHPFVLVFVAIAVANMVQKTRKAGTQQQARRFLDTNADTVERTRRVQEEIRRKIAERAGRIPVGPPPVPPLPSAGPSSAAPSRNIFQELARQMEEAKKITEMRERAQAAAEAQAQQRVVAEQETRELAEAQHLAEAQRTLERQPRTVATAVAGTATDLKTTTVNSREKLLENLREPDGLRRAWVLREVLGEPVGLR